MTKELGSDRAAIKQVLPYISKYRNSRFLFVVPAAFLLDERYESTSIWEDLAACANLQVRSLLLISHNWGKIEGLAEEVILGKLAEISTLELRARTLLSNNAHKFKHSDNVLSGSWFTAQTRGVLRGKNMQHYGKVRAIDTDSMQRHLAAGDMLVFSNLVPGRYSGFYAVDAYELALETAKALQVEKVISYVDDLPRHFRKLALEINEARDLILSLKEEDPLLEPLQQAINYCAAGIDRAHILPVSEDGALFQEVLSVDGCGMMVNSGDYETLVTARQEDINEIKRLITPWEEKEVLRPRSLEELTETVQRFLVIKQDDKIISCAALSPIENMPDYAELECVVVSEAYRRRGYGKRLINSVEKFAVTRGYKYLVAFSTQTYTWFEELGYTQSAIKFPLHHCCADRHSKTLVKKLEPRNSQR